MVSGNPPRHSKSDKDPVTIELEANKTAADEAQDLANRSSVTDEPDDIAATEEQSETSTANSDETPNPAQSEPASETAAAAFSEEPAAASAFEKKPQPASTSSSFAAGILGGLIALAAAGGLQYAGILSSLGPGSDNSASQQALKSDVATIKAELAKAPAPAGNVDLTPLEQRIAGIEQKLAEAPAAGSGAPTDISALEATIANLTAELDTLKRALADTGKQQETVKTEIDQRLDAAEQKLSEPSNDAKMARAVAAAALKTAIERGGPFLAELDALASVAPDDAAVAALRADAATGVPSRADLAKSFSETANTMLDALADTGAEAGVFDRLMNSASSLVRVRPVGNIEGESPDAVIARIENKIVNGDLKGASLEWEALPEKARTAGADFKSVLDRRIKAEELVGSSVSGALSSGNQG
ncbi:hypothetical protein [Pararhizobium sp.]|uniref:hypothetical protein n=1 Tax=Pararhizobium sp. TaxID=1977563 RepID=UPI0027234151|nr:hypothetical protein [Pararhizobium sp.]MDO9416538.1 hypothetical protein [Pararhizobium sp.]